MDSDTLLLLLLLSSMGPGSPAPYPVAPPIGGGIVVPPPAPAGIPAGPVIVAPPPGPIPARRQSDAARIAGAIFDPLGLFGGGIRNLF